MAQFDGVVIGAGHNGLVCAAYLARAGLKVAVLDCESEIGGGSSTKEFLLPGYQSNMHANFFIGLDDFPIVKDLELDKHGFNWLTPDVQHAALYRDGTAILLHRDAEKSAASISKFSQKDAESYAYLHRRFAVELAPLLRSFLFHPPLPPEEIVSRMDSDAGREILSFAKMSIFEAIESNFEHPKMRALFFLFSHAITVENAPGTGIFLPSLFSTHTTLGLPVGGAIQLPLALERIIIQNGGVVLRSSHVREVIRENGRATGVMLEGGEKMMATQFVASSLNAPASIKMAGEDAFPDEVNEKVRNWDWGFHSLSTLHLALAEPPRYSAADFDPDVSRAYNIIFGADSGEEMAENTEERRNGLIPSRPMGNGSCNSQHDPSYAPPGGHVAFWWPGAPYELKDGGPRKWDEVKEEYTERLVDVWRGYAPNLTPDNVRAAKLYTPLDVERGNKNMIRGGVRMGAYIPEQLGINRPHPLLSGMRTPLEGFYLCSSSCQGGGLNGAPGYNAAGVIADDLGVEKWWEPLPAPAASAG